MLTPRVSFGCDSPTARWMRMLPAPRLRDRGLSGLRVAPTSLPSPASSTRRRSRRMLMSGSGKAARVHYLAGTFRLLSDGDHVICAVTGERIPLHELRYWSVERQEPYADAQASLKAEQAAAKR